MRKTSERDPSHSAQTVLSKGASSESTPAFIPDEELVAIEQRMPRKSQNCLDWVQQTFPNHRLNKVIYKMMILRMIEDERWKDFQQIIIADGFKLIIAQMIEDAAVNIWNGRDPNQ